MLLFVISPSVGYADSSLVRGSPDFRNIASIFYLSFPPHAKKPPAGRLFDGLLLQGFHNALGIRRDDKLLVGGDHEDLDLGGRL